MDVERGGGGGLIGGFGSEVGIATIDTPVAVAKGGPDVEAAISGSIGAEHPLIKTYRPPSANILDNQEPLVNHL